MSKKNKIFSGVFTALVTPFNEHDELDLESFTKLVQKQKDASGIIIAGSTGEGVCLSEKELESLILTSKNVAPHLLTIASTGSNCTKKSLELQKIAENAGADAHLSVAPYYNKPSQQGLFRHFSTLAKNATKPIILYNNPSRSIIEIKPETAKHLMLEHENIAGIKQADTCMHKLSELLNNAQEHRPDFSILSGEDDAFWPFLQKNADGIISMTSNIALFEMSTIYKNKDSEPAYAEKIAQKLLPLYKLLFTHSNPLAIKTVMAQMGLLQKQFRLPLCPLLAHEEEQLLKQFEAFSFLKMVKENA